MAARLPPVFLGRVSERQALDRLLMNVRGGQSAILVIRGEAGVGKTALLHYCARQASGFRVAQIAGVEAEMELPFAGLHQLCAPILARLDALPDPQRDALSVAPGRDSRRADAAGGADSAPRARRTHELGDRRPVVPQPSHRRMAPEEGVHQARDQIANRPPRRASGRRPGRHARVVTGASDQCVYGRGAGVRSACSPLTLNEQRRRSP